VTSSTLLYALYSLQILSKGVHRELLLLLDTLLLLQRTCLLEGLLLLLATVLTSPLLTHPHVLLQPTAATQINAHHGHTLKQPLYCSCCTRMLYWQISDSTTW
jgi:hypothetical protein